MTIDWTHFTPWTALAGGILLGIASAAFILVNGRVLGISGILGGLLVPRRSDASWRVFFLLGLVLAPATRAARGPGNPLWVGLHQRPRRVRAVTALAALARGHRGLHGLGLRHGLCRPPPVLNPEGVIHAPFL